MKCTSPYFSSIKVPFLPPSLRSLWLNYCLVGQTTQRYVQEAETQVFSLWIFMCFSYRPPAKHTWGVFVWKTVGSSRLCITWKPCMEDELCSASVDPPAAVPCIMAGSLYLATQFGIHRFLDCSTSHGAWGASPQGKPNTPPARFAWQCSSFYLAAAALQDVPPPPSKEGAQKNCVATKFTWTSRERCAFWALSMPNTACPRLLEKAKPLRWSQQQQNAACEKQAGSCWILALCFPTHAGFCTNVPTKLMRTGRNKREKKKKEG